MTYRRQLTLVLLAILLGIVHGQRSEVGFELGFGGAPVDGAWNPLRIVVRDQPALQVEIRMDQGSARTGPIPYVYSATIRPSRGVGVFEDDLFVPPWYSLTWTVRGGDRVIASGSFDPRRRDDRPLALLLSSRPGSWLEHMPADLRVQEVSAGGLPQRAAAYSGVRALLIDGTSAAPALEAVAAAAAAGVTVAIHAAVPDSHAHLRALAAGAGGQRYGAGQVLIFERPEELSALVSSAPETLRSSLELLETGVAEVRPPLQNRLTVAAAAGAYVLLVLVLLRFGNAGVVSALTLALVASLGAWSALRPRAALLEETSSVRIAAGGLALELPSRTIVSLPGGTVELGEPVRSVTSTSYSVTGGESSLYTQRWQPQVLLGRPRLAQPILAWQGDELTNRGQMPLRWVAVSGMGDQGTLSAGASRKAILGEEVNYPPNMERLLRQVPEGVAVASDGTNIYIAFPESVQEEM